jgi:hypothetical protein
MKYKFKETEGCLEFKFTVNGEDIRDVSYKQQKEIVDYLCEKMKRRIVKGTMFLPDIVKLFKETNYGSTKVACDMCGDKVNWTIWDL